jgi:hypothetical protein
MVINNQQHNFLAKGGYQRNNNPKTESHQQYGFHRNLLLFQLGILLLLSMLLLVIHIQIQYIYNKIDHCNADISHSSFINIICIVLLSIIILFCFYTMFIKLQDSEYKKMDAPRFSNKNQISKSFITGTWEMITRKDGKKRFAFLGMFMNLIFSIPGWFIVCAINMILAIEPIKEAVANKKCENVTELPWFEKNNMLLILSIVIGILSLLVNPIINYFADTEISDKAGRRVQNRQQQLKNRKENLDILEQEGKIKEDEDRRNWFATLEGKTCQKCKKINDHNAGDCTKELRSYSDENVKKCWEYTQLNPNVVLKQYEDKRQAQA